MIEKFKSLQIQIEKLKKENQQLIAQLKEMKKDYEFMKKAYNSLKGDD